MKKEKILVAATGLVVLTLCGCGKTKINLNDYLTVDFSGVDGHGEANMFNNIVMKNKGDYSYEVIGDDLKVFGN